ncbi:MAG: hypothetical protein OXM02_03280 [Bacteroidota bacterium]|nr:hypothetical protein [Bacteroidota bacterium]MDE2956227.1 hypothetical protein [Bacteroidota bacterium]
MKHFFVAAVLLIAGQTAAAQIPVIDAASLAEAIATTTQLRRQVEILVEEVELAWKINQNAAAHLRRYEQSLRRRGVVVSVPLTHVLERIEASQFTRKAVTYSRPADLRTAYRMHEKPDDPVATRRMAANRTMATLEGVLGALSVHNENLVQANHELETFKTEIDRSTEPRQVMDVQASLQVLEARELMLTRQALMTLANLEAVRTAEEISRRAQQQARYEAFIGGTAWLGSPHLYRVDRFLRMPGDP